MLTFFDCEACERFLVEAVSHYAKSAPTVAAYLDDVYVRLTTDSDVTLVELINVQALKDEAGWLQPNYAANRVYKLQDRLGMDTTCHAGF